MLALLVAAVGYLYNAGHLDRFMPEEEKAPTALTESTDPERHVANAQEALERLDQQERCSHFENDHDAPCTVPRYDRVAQFGRAWADVDQDGCGTREQVLARDLDDVEQRPDCYVVSGVLEDPFTGKTHTDRSKIDIDHLVSLSQAWDMGAHEWPHGKRVAFANDTEVNLLAVDGKTNQHDKKDYPLAEWEPSTDYTCTFAIKYVWAHDAYDLPITAADYERASDIFDKCDVVYGEPTDAEPLPESVWDYAERF